MFHTIWEFVRSGNQQIVYNTYYSTAQNALPELVQLQICNKKLTTISIIIVVVKVYGII